RADVRSRNVRVADQQPHLKGACPQRHSRADVAYADDTDGLAHKLGALEAGAIGPAVRFHRVVGCDAVARERDHLPEGELRHGSGVDARHVRHPHLMLARRSHIDARDVHADAGARDDLQTATAFLDVAARDAPFAADHGVDLRRLALPALWLGPRIHDDGLRARTQPLNDPGLEFLDEDAAKRHAAILVANLRSIWPPRMTVSFSVRRANHGKRN